MNQISLEWSRYPDSPIVSVETRGLPRLTLRHYARQAGFVELRSVDGAPVFVGMGEQRDGLLCLLERAGYEIEEEMMQ